mmetsp:Transcript_95315/g.308784  ORF Transcript_95315/g.308784 Transcript_95315/m.308784 type:complete len:246 (-) Transcript_95315:595-1332(-)
MALSMPAGLPDELNFRCASLAARSAASVSSDEASLHLAIFLPILETRTLASASKESASWYHSPESLKSATFSWAASTACPDSSSYAAAVMAVNAAAWPARLPAPLKSSSASLAAVRASRLCSVCKHTSATKSSAEASPLASPAVLKMAATSPLAPRASVCFFVTKRALILVLNAAVCATRSSRLLKMESASSTSAKAASPFCSARCEFATVCKAAPSPSLSPLARKMAKASSDTFKASSGFQAEM